MLPCMSSIERQLYSIYDVECTCAVHNRYMYVYLNNFIHPNLVSFSINHIWLIKAWPMYNLGESILLIPLFFHEISQIRTWHIVMHDPVLYTLHICTFWYTYTKQTYFCSYNYLRCVMKIYTGETVNIALYISGLYPSSVSVNWL